MEDRKEPRPKRAPLGDQRNHRVAIDSVERGGRFVENQEIVLAREAAGDVDPLLLAARKGRGRQGPEVVGQVEAGEQRRRPRSRRLNFEPRAARRRGDDVKRRDARDNAQKPAHIAHDPAPCVDNLARARLRNVEKSTAVGEQDSAAVRPVIAIGHFEDRGLAGARRPAEHDALAPFDGESDARDDRQPRPAVQVQREGLFEALDDEEIGGRGHHAASTEKTSSCV